MADKRVRFNSRNEDYRSPVGALKAGTELRLSIDITKDIMVHRVFALVKYDPSAEPVSYDMTREGASFFGDENFDRYSTVFSVFDTGLYWYRFEIDTDLGHLTVGKGEGNSPVIWDPFDLKGGCTNEPPFWQITVYYRQFDEPEWLLGGIVYQIYVDRFKASGTRGTLHIDVGNDERIEYKGKILRGDWGGLPDYKPVNGEILNNDFFGGDIRGITKKLPYLKDLGVSCIYLGPIFEAYSNHKYDTGDYEKIDEMFGTEFDFKELCIKAHQLGMRIILDGVFAHTGADSKYFNRYGNYGQGGAWNDPDSPYRDWYAWTGEGSYDSWWGIDTMPKTNKSSESFKNFICGEDGILRQWMRKGASGWRFDVVDEYPAAFTAKMCEAVKAEQHDAYTVGEVWEDASNKEAYGERKNYFKGDKIDGVMNYLFKNPMICYLKSGDASGLADIIEETCENYPPECMNAVMNYLGSHDSRRILTYLAGDDISDDASRDEQAAIRMTDEQRARGIRMLKAASVIQMTLPGVPCIYYGDEVGLEGYRDPFNRGCYPWSKEDKELLDWYKTIASVRRGNEVYKRGRYKTIAAENGLFIFERCDASGRILTAVNAAEGSRSVGLEGVWKDHITGAEISGSVTLGQFEVMILERI